MRKLYWSATIVVVAGIAVVLTTSAFAGERRATILVKDDCEPASFNLAIGPGTCVGNGETTFQEFVAELKDNRTIDDWEFDSRETDVRAGTPIVVRNVGGETHTFTRVARFGPGFVPFLNLLVFGVAGPPVPEFLQPPSTFNFIPAGGTIVLATGPGTSLPVGKYRFECGIHPWMRGTVTVRRGGD
jgi:plastocyanin